MEKSRGIHRRQLGVRFELPNAVHWKTICSLNRHFILVNETITFVKSRAWESGPNFQSKIRAIILVKQRILGANPKGRSEIRFLISN